MLEIILYTTIAGVVGTGLGGVISALIKKETNILTSVLLSFAGGIMLSVVCFDLLLTALGNPITSQNIVLVVLVTLISIILFYFLNRFIDKYTEKRNSHFDENHPKTHDDLDELIHSDTYTTYSSQKASQRKLFQAGIIMILAIALHNLPEGISIGSSYNHSKETGIVLAILIALHNIPEGMAVAVPLIVGGTKRIKAVLLTALSGFPTVLGAMLGYWIGEISQLGLQISLCVASGAMLYVVFGEILPQSILLCRSKAPSFAAMIGLLLGLLIVFLI